MRLLTRYNTRDALAADVRDQLPRGGMMVRTAVPAGVELFSRIEVAIACGADEVVVTGQVLQVFPEIGVAVGLDRSERTRVESLAGVPMTAVPVESAPIPITTEISSRVARGTTMPPGGRIAVPGVGEMREVAAPEPRRELATGSSPAIDRIQLALRGDRDQRFDILRGRNRALHVYVLRNPGLTFDEICMIAKMPSVSPEVLTQIAERREWGHRPEVAFALCRNPTTPVPAAVKLLEHVSAAELRILAKDAGTREPIQRAARKKLLA